jgi:hypothetical protein
MGLVSGLASGRHLPKFLDPKSLDLITTSSPIHSPDSQGQWQADASSLPELYFDAVKRQLLVLDFSKITLQMIARTDYSTDVHRAALGIGLIAPHHFIPLRQGKRADCTKFSGTRTLSAADAELARYIAGSMYPSSTTY